MIAREEPATTFARRHIGPSSRDIAAMLETVSAKMRIFRVPEFLCTAFLLAVIAMLVHILLGA